MTTVQRLYAFVAIALMGAIAAIVFNLWNY